MHYNTEDLIHLPINRLTLGEINNLIDDLIEARVEIRDLKMKLEEIKEREDVSVKD